MDSLVDDLFWISLPIFVILVNVWPFIVGGVALVVAWIEFSRWIRRRSMSRDDAYLIRRVPRARAAESDRDGGSAS